MLAAVVQAINGNFDWSIDSILQDIKYLSNSFESIAYSHIPSYYNLIAHEYARLASPWDVISVRCRLDRDRDLIWCLVVFLFLCLFLFPLDESLFS